MVSLTPFELALRDLRLTEAEFDAMTADMLRRHWRELIKASHPDLPENQGKSWDAGAINAAHDVLRQELIARGRETARTSDLNNVWTRQNIWRYDRASIAPPWQPDKQAKNHKILAETYRDVNYFKKRMWELSDRSEEVYHLDAFGQQGFEGRTSVYGSARVFDEMAKAMLIWNANGSRIELTRAVLASPANDAGALFLIYADGKFFDKNPIRLPYDWKAGSPGRDKNLRAKLPVVLDQLQDMLGRRAAG